MGFIPRHGRPPPPGAVPVSVDPPYVLIVAGEPGFQVHLAAMELAGYRTAVAESRPSARVWLEECRFDLVLFDVELPDTDHLCRARWWSGADLLAQSITGAGNSIARPVSAHGRLGGFCTDDARDEGREFVTGDFATDEAALVAWTTEVADGGCLPEAPFTGLSACQFDQAHLRSVTRPETCHSSCRGARRRPDEFGQALSSESAGSGHGKPSVSACERLPPSTCA